MSTPVDFFNSLFKQFYTQAKFNGCPFVGGVLELARSKAREETGRLSPPQSVTAFRLSSMVIIPRDLEFLGLLM